MAESRNTALDRGQSTFELALLLPVVCSLLFLILKAYHANHDASDRSILLHGEALKAFNHGNSDAVVIDGEKIVPGRLDELIPPDRINVFSPSSLPGLGSLDLGVNDLLSHVPFMDGDNVLTGYAKGYSNEAAGQYVDSGFIPDKIDWRAAQRAGYVGSLTSQQSAQWFQGADTTGSTAQEFYGSAAQGGAVAWVKNGYKGDAAFAGGFVGGMLGSDTSRIWFQTGDEILKGAVRGALAGSISGVANGGKFDAGDIAAQATMGAFYTKAVAERFPWAGGTLDPRSAATFGATNAAVAALLSTGSKATFGDVALAAATGGFFSGQSMQIVRGDHTGLVGEARVAAAGAGYGAAVSAVTHGDTEAIGRSVYQSILSGIGSNGGNVEINPAAAMFSNSASTTDVQRVLRGSSGVEGFARNYVRSFRAQ